MPAGHVNRTTLAANYQNPGDTYDDTKTEGAFEVLAQQSDDNYDEAHLVKTTLESSTLGSSGTEYVKSPAITNVDGTNAYAQILDLKKQIDNLVIGLIPDNTLTTAKLKDKAVTAAKVADDVATQAELDAHKAEDSSLTQKGHVQLSSDINSTDETMAATPKSVTDSINAYKDSVIYQIKTSVSAGVSVGSVLIKEIQVDSRFGFKWGMRLDVLGSSGTERIYGIYRILKTNGSDGIKIVTIDTNAGSTYIPTLTVTYDSASDCIMINQVGSPSESGSTHYAIIVDFVNLDSANISNLPMFV